MIEEITTRHPGIHKWISGIPSNLVGIGINFGNVTRSHDKTAVSTHPSLELHSTFPLSKLREGMSRLQAGLGRVEKPLYPTNVIPAQAGIPSNRRRKQINITNTNNEIPDIRYATSGNDDTTQSSSRP